MKIGTTELLIILAVVLIIFGPSQIPKLTRMIGRSIREFRRGMDDEPQSTASQQDQITEKQTVHEQA